MADGIEQIVFEHRAVDALFAEFDAGDPTAVGRILDALTMHDEGEQHVLYPLIAEVAGGAGLDDAALAHSKVKMLMDRIRSSEGAALVDAMFELRSAVDEHVRDEEQRLLPALREAASPAQVEMLAARMVQVRQRVG
jgi:hemerythrin superfamily protein